jgi:hypothetical protein
MPAVYSGSSIESRDLAGTRRRDDYRRCVGVRLRPMRARAVAICFCSFVHAACGGSKSNPAIDRTKPTEAGAGGSTGASRSMSQAGARADAATSRPADAGTPEAGLDCPPGSFDSGLAPCAPEALTATDLNACGATRDNASRVASGMLAGFRNCYNRALAENPDASGLIILRIYVGPQGEVTGTSATTEGNVPYAVTGCIRARASAAQFAPATGPTTLVFALRLGCWGTRMPD